MANSLRHDFYSDLASTISNDIQYKRSNYYYFLGKVEPWGPTDLAPSVIETDSVYENTRIRANAVYLKKITPNDVTLVTDRYDWASGTVFASWDHTKSMNGQKFYCITDDNNVYKCLDNNAGTASTVKPSGKSFYVFRTSDGYLWKYMYTVPSFKRTRFTSLTKLPIQRSLSDSFYNKGAIDAVYVSSRGTGYSDALLTSLQVSGSTTGSGGAGTITVGPTGNITGVTITNGGAGYTSGVRVGVTTLSGSQAVGVATTVAGAITGITWTNAGVGYANGEHLTFTVGGAILIPSVSKTTGSIVGVKVINPGAGYTSISVTPIGAGGAGTGKYGNASAVITPVLYQGSIVEVLIADPGINYPADNATTIVVQGDGVGAKFNPVVYQGEIVDVTTENAGSGYTSVTLSVVGGGTGASLTPIISTSDFSSDQSIVEQTAVVGAIYSIKVTEPGSNYSTGASVVITGDGTGATAHAVINSGQIINIVLDTYGSGYTYADVTIVDPSRPVIGNNINAAAYVVLPPPEGHGKDAVNELYGSTLAINTSLRQDSKLNQLLQDYRQFGLIKNPTNIYTGKLLTEDSSLLVYSVTFTSTVGLKIDEVLVMDSVKFRVLLVEGNTVYLQQLGIKYISPIGTMVSVLDSARIYNSTGIITSPTGNKYSGNLLYVSDENPFTFNEAQGITIKTFLKF